MDPVGKALAGECDYPISHYDVLVVMVAEVVDDEEDIAELVVGIGAALPICAEPPFPELGDVDLVLLERCLAGEYQTLNGRDGPRHSLGICLAYHRCHVRQL